MVTIYNVVRFVELESNADVVTRSRSSVQTSPKGGTTIKAINILINGNNSDKFTTSLTSFHFTCLHARHVHFQKPAHQKSRAITRLSMALTASSRLKWTVRELQIHVAFVEGGRGEVSTSLSIWQSAGVERCTVISSTDFPKPSLDLSVRGCEPNGQVELTCCLPFLPSSFTHFLFTYTTDTSKTICLPVHTTIESFR